MFMAVAVQVRFGPAKRTLRPNIPLPSDMLAWPLTRVLGSAEAGSLGTW